MPYRILYPQAPLIHTLRAGMQNKCITYFFYVLGRFYNTKGLNTLPSLRSHPQLTSFTADWMHPAI